MNRPATAPQPVPGLTRDLCATARPRLGGRGGEVCR